VKTQWGENSVADHSVADHSVAENLMEPINNPEDHAGEESIESASSDNGDLTPGEEGIANHDMEDIDPHSVFKTDDESDFEEPGPVPTLPTDENEQAENPTFPSSS
jgi:hypothetical protein